MAGRVIGAQQLQVRHNGRMNPFREFRLQARTHGVPATAAIIALMATCFVLSWFGLAILYSGLALEVRSVFSQPWTMLTYPFASPGATHVLFFVLTCLWLWSFGGSVERDLGSARFVLAWIVLTLLFSIVFVAASGVIEVPLRISEAGLPTAAMTMIWCARNPETQILLLFILPIKGKWLALLTSAIVLFSYGAGYPLVGAIALLPLAVAWAFGANMLPFWAYASSTDRRGLWEKKREQREHHRFIDDIKDRERERSEKERLRKLFEDSLDDDQPD